MTDEELDFIKKKQNCVLATITNVFEDHAFNFMRSNEWHNVRDIDAWFDTNLREYYKIRAEVKSYYDAQQES